jgi:hypothetical protein
MSQVQPLMLQNGIFLQTREFNHETHLDTAHLMRMNAQYPQPTHDMGMITPWIATGYMDRPGLFDMTRQASQRILIDGHIWKWEQPLADQPVYIIEDISGQDKPGLDNTTFSIKLNERRWGNGAVICVDKFSQLELLVTEDEVIGDNASGYIMKVRMLTTNSKYKWFPKEYLTAGTIFYQKGSINGEYSQTYNDLGTIKTGYREFYNYVGEGTAHTHYSCTRDAAYSKVSHNAVINLQQYRKVIEMLQFTPGSPAADAVLRGESPAKLYMKQAGGNAKRANELAAQDIVKRAWIPEVEAIGMTRIELDVEMYAVWGAGGTTKVDGKTEVHMPVGLFHQLNLGATYTFNIPKFRLDKIEAIITGRLKDKINPYGQNTITIGVGAAMLKLVRQQIQERFQAQNFVMEGTERWIKGSDNQMLYLDAPRFQSYRWEYGILKFELIPALDPIVANDLENPYVGAHRLSSYVMIIDDLSGEGSNICEMVYGPDWDFQHRFINGKMNYLDVRGSGGFGAFQSSSHHPGFEVFMEKRHKAYWIKDITKSLLIKPINPRTGKPIFEPVFS